jgi:hypothetical protein
VCPIFNPFKIDTILYGESEDSEEEREARAEAEGEFDRLLAWLERTYTRVFATLRRCSSPSSSSSSLRRVGILTTLPVFSRRPRTKLDCHSLILEWPGRDRRLKPFLLASHMGACRCVSSCVVCRVVCRVLCVVCRVSCRCVPCVSYLLTVLMCRHTRIYRCGAGGPRD